MTEQEILEIIKANLGDNYIENDDEILLAFISDYTLIASNESNRKTTDSKLVPYVKKAVISAYLRRGKEGNSANTEGGLSDTYIDIEEKLSKDVRNIRLLR